MRLLQVSATTYRRLSLAAVVAIVGLVATGGWVRVSESGLGCPTWPKCTGTSVVAPGSSYHAWVEFSNRCLITAIAVLIGVLLVTALAARPRRRELVALSLGLLAGYVAEAVLGGLTVLAKLNPVLVAGHLIVALVLLSNAVALHWLASTPGPVQPGRRWWLPATTPRVPRRVVTGARVMAACFWLTVVLGTVVTGTGPYSGDPGTPRFHFDLLRVVQAHGSGGALLTVAVLANLGLLATVRAPAECRRRLWVATAVLAVQGGLGLSVYFSHFRAGLIEAHVIGAAVLLVALMRYSLSLFAPVPAVADAPEPRPGVSAPALAGRGPAAPSVTGTAVHHQPVAP